MKKWLHLSYLQPDLLLSISIQYNEIEIPEVRNQKYYHVYVMGTVSKNRLIDQLLE